MKKTAIAHANIALVKYWGKRDPRLNLPAVGSISLTLAALSTTTTVDFRDDLLRDELILNGAPAAQKATVRAGDHLDLLRKRAEKNGFARINTRNNFPTGAGLASSASGFAALTLAAAAALEMELSPRELSRLARRGSGSAGRSLLGGIVAMHRGEQPDGSDAFAEALHPPHFWPLEMLILVTSEMEKAIGSTEGMNRTAQTSPYYRQWVDTAEADLRDARLAIAARDFEKLGEITEFSCFKMHGLALSANPAILYWNAETVSLIHEVRSLRKSGIPAYLTIDAGPQIKILTLPGHSDQIVAHFRGHDGITRIIRSGIGDDARVLT